MLKTNTTQLLSARRAQENVDVIIIDGSAYLWIPSWPASGTIQHYIEKFKYHIGQMYSLHLTDTKSAALREPLEHQEALTNSNYPFHYQAVIQYHHVMVWENENT